MKKIFTILFLLISLPAFGQTTSVTGTITTAWAQGSYSITLAGQQGVQYLLNGSKFTTVFSGTLDASGSFSASLADNNAVTPGGSQWRFSFCANIGVPCFSVQLTITGIIQSVSAQIQAQAPPITGPVVNNPVPGSSIFSSVFGNSSPGITLIGNAGQVSPLAYFLNSSGGLGVAISARGIVFPDGSLQTSAASGAVLPAISGATANLALTNNGSISNWGVLSVAGGGTGLSTLGSALQCLQVNSGATALQYGTCGSGVSSFTGDGTLLNNSASTGAVTATLANAAAMSLWGNPSASAAVPGYTSNPLLSSLLLQPTTAVTGATLRVFGDTGSEDIARFVTNGGSYGIKVDSAGAVWAGDATHSGQWNLYNGANGLHTLVQSFSNAANVVFNLPAGNGTAGQLLASGGGGTNPMTWVSALANPMTTLGDTLYGGASGAVTRLAGPTVNGTYCEQEVVTASAAVPPAWGTCGGGSGLPSSWSIGAGNFVNAAPTASTDTTTLSIAPSLATGGTYNIFQVGNASLNSAQVGCTANVYWAITFNGNMCFSASNLQLSTSTGAAPYFYLNGINSYPGQPFVKTATAELGAPTLAVSNVATGGTVASGTYYFKITYVNPAGETVGSTEAPTTTTGSTSTITVTAPGAQYSAFGYQIYEASTSGSEKILVPTSSNCTLATATFGGNAVCAVSSNATFTSIPTAGSLTPPTTNTTGGAYIAGFAPAADGLGMFLASGAPGADAPIDSGLMLPGGTGVNFTSGASTPANTLACLSGSNTVSECGANAANTVIGVFSSSGQNSLVQTTGIATVNLAASATTTANDFACSNATAGTVVDNGTTACASGQQVGIIAQTNAVAVTSVPVLLRFTASVPPSNTTATVGTTAIAANTCTAQTAISVAGLTPAMTVNFTATSDTSGVTGWGSPSAGLLYITDYPSSGSVNWKVCNPTSSSITPGASVTFNVSAR